MSTTYPELATLQALSVMLPIGCEGWRYALCTPREHYMLPLEGQDGEMAAMEWALSQGWTFVGFRERDPVFRRDRVVQQMRFIQECTVLGGPVWAGYPAIFCKDHGVLPEMTPQEVALHMRTHGWNLPPLIEGTTVTVQRFDSMFDRFG